MSKPKSEQYSFKSFLTLLFLLYYTCCILLYISEFAKLLLLFLVQMTWNVEFKGRVPGVYEHWEDAHRQVNGFKGNLYKGYPTRSIAEGHWRRRNRGRMGTDAGYLVILPLVAFLVVMAYVLYM